MKDLISGAVQSKTIWVSSIMAALGYVIANSNAIQVAVSPKVYGLTLMILGAIMAALRAVTTESLADKAPATPAVDAPKQGGFARVNLLVALALVGLVGCAQISKMFGTPEPQTDGQRLVYGYDSATKADSLAKSLRASAAINQTMRDGVHAGAKSLHDAVDAYWDARAVYAQCLIDQKTAPPMATSGTASVDPCGPPPTPKAALSAVNASLPALLEFLSAHPGSQ